MPENIDFKSMYKETYLQLQAAKLEIQERNEYEDKFFADIEPYVQGIENSRGWFKVFKIAKLTIKLVQLIVNYMNYRKLKRA